MKLKKELEANAIRFYRGINKYKHQNCIKRVNTEVNFCLTFKLNFIDYLAGCLCQVLVFRNIFMCLFLLLLSYWLNMLKALPKRMMIL